MHQSDIHIVHGHSSFSFFETQVVVNGIKFFDRREVRDVLAYLKVLHAPYDNDLALERIINVPPRAIGDKTVLRIQNMAVSLQCSMWEVLERMQEVEEKKKRKEGKKEGKKDKNQNQNQRDAARTLEYEMSMQKMTGGMQTRSKNLLLDFKSMMDGLRRSELFREEKTNFEAAKEEEMEEEEEEEGGVSVSNALVHIVKEIGYDNWIRYENAGGEERWGNIRELVNFASSAISIENWLDEVALLSDPQDLGGSNGTTNKKKQKNVEENGGGGDGSGRVPVKLMTIHASKGSEFDVVFVAGVEEELLPHYFALEENDVEEERRLCYVAVTRAKRRVCLTLTKQRTLWGQKKQAKPSQFLIDLDDPDVQWMTD